MGHGHQHLHKRQQGGLTTINGQVYSVTYVTAEPTFDGVIGGYTTLTDGVPAQSASASGGRSSSQATNTIPVAATASTFVASISTAQSSASSASPTTSAATRTGVADSAATSSTTSSTSSSTSGGDGMSTGAKAGVAIGIIAGIGLIAALLLWCIGKKKKQRKAQETRANDEKTTFGASRNAINMQNTGPPSSTGPAPRLSIRPMSRNLLGDFGFGGTNRRSAGNMLNTVSETPQRTASPAPQNVRPQTPQKNPFADPENPFADPARTAPTMAAPTKPLPTPDTSRMAPPPAPNPDRIAFTGSWPAAPAGYEPQASAPQPQLTALPSQTMSPAVSEMHLPIMGTRPSLPPSSPGPASAAFGGTAAVGAAAVAATGAVAASKAVETRRERPQPENQPERRAAPQPSTAEPRTEQARPAPRDAAPSPVPAPSPVFASGGAPASPNPSVNSNASQQGGNVYRVMMDFAPSMDDELDLKAGQLVRLLHEYDDGWALCIRLDRSKQGVVPRTCLAAKPSKPKPSHLHQYARGPGGNGRDSPMGRPMSPASDPRGRNSPAMGRPMSPGMGRPMSPSGGPQMRPMSPGGRQMRPMSPAGGRGPGPNHGPSGRSNRPMSPGAYNQAPRPLSPGPMRGGPGGKRSQSPGPYGATGPLPMPGAPQRRRSNSASAFQERRMSPPGPSKLGQGRPMSPAPGMAL